MSGTRQYLTTNVLQIARKRIEYAYRNFELVVVAVSGGKDSGVVLNLSIDIARKLNKLPVIVSYTDEEALDPYTEEILLSYSTNPDINFHWFALPIPMKNGCSSQQNSWTTWDKTQQDKWVRYYPPTAITVNQFPEWLDFLAKTNKDPFYFVNTVYFRSQGYTNAIVLRGLRTEESRNRFRAVWNDRNQNWITKKPDLGVMYAASPIYDWLTNDVWLAYKQFGWHYNQLYDVLALFGIPSAKQRICQPIYEYNIKDLPIYRKIFPDYWKRLNQRFDGVEACTRYAETFLYSAGQYTEKPPNMSWEDVFNSTIQFHPAEVQKKILAKVGHFVRSHYNYTGDPVPDNINHPMSKISWKKLTRIALTGDWDNRVGASFVFGIVQH